MSHQMAEMNGGAELLYRRLAASASAPSVIVLSTSIAR